MKTITLKPTEFHAFRQLALSMGLLFTCTIAHSIYTIEANAKQLKEIGY
jgi:hypothetical protein